jgi:hypothetical protein
LVVLVDDAVAVVGAAVSVPAASSASSLPPGTEQKYTSIGQSLAVEYSDSPNQGRAILLHSVAEHG